MTSTLPQPEKTLDKYFFHMTKSAQSSVKEGTVLSVYKKRIILTEDDSRMEYSI